MVKPIDKSKLDDFKSNSMKNWKVTNGILAGRKVHLTINGEEKVVSFNQLYKTLENLTASLSDEKKAEVLAILTAIQILDGANKTSNPLTQLFNFTFNRAQVIKEIESKAVNADSDYLKLKNEVLEWVKENPKFFDYIYPSMNNKLNDGHKIVNELLSAMQSKEHREDKINDLKTKGALDYLEAASKHHGNQMRASWTKLCSIVFNYAKNPDEQTAIAELAKEPYSMWFDDENLSMEIDGEDLSVNSSKNPTEWENSASKKLQDFVNKK